MSTLTQYRVELVEHDPEGDHVRQSAIAADEHAAGALRVAWEHLGSSVAGRTEVRTVLQCFDVPDWGAQ